jgi:hypothetical protein
MSKAARQALVIVMSMFDVISVQRRDIHQIYILICAMDGVDQGFTMYFTNRN